MSWITVALIAIGALVLVTLIYFALWLIVLRAGRRWFEGESKRMDEEHEEFRRRAPRGFGPRR